MRNRLRRLEIAVSVSLLLSVILLYHFAPCMTFYGWKPYGWDLQSVFFGIVWPLLIPAIFTLALLSVWNGSEPKGQKWIWVGWILLTILVIYGWVTGYLTTYIWWRSSEGAPWPHFC